MACNCWKTAVARLTKDKVIKLAQTCANEFNEPYVVYKNDHFYYYMPKKQADEEKRNYLHIINANN